MRVLVLLVAVVFSAGCGRAQPPPVGASPTGAFDERIANSINYYFYDYLGAAREHLAKHDMACSYMLPAHERVQGAFVYLAVTLDGYHSRLGQRLELLVKDLNAVRADIEHERGCIPDH